MFDRFLPILFKGFIGILVVAVFVTGWFVVSTVLQKPDTPRTAAERAIMDGEEAVKADPRSVDARLSLAAAYAGAGNHNAAVEQLKAATRLDTRSTRAHYMLGVVYKDQGNLDDAIASFKKAAKFPGELGDVYNNIYYELGMAYKEKKQYKEAVEAFTEAQKFGMPLYLLMELGDAYEKVGKIDEAKLAYMNVLQRDIENADALRELKRLKVDQKIIDDVLKTGRGQHLGTNNTGAAETAQPAAKK